MPNRWLVKTEPTTYSFDDLARERRTTWDGVRNALAQQHLRAMRKGDEVLVYHSGRDKAVIGLARVTRAPFPDPAAGDSAMVAVDLAAGHRLKQPVSLAAIRADPAFAGFALVRISRLSVMPVSAAEWKHLLALGAG
ncbi:MAG TPA: EVE domain-containing protein [Gemmatimonadales bacterium]|nr:EVE domain-containing protein [Gemmatimonadales bacterium]